MDKQKFINYLNNELGTQIDDETSPFYPYVEELYEALLPYEKELEAILEDAYPDGMDETELNDLLWFESETVFEWLGIGDEEDEDEEG